MRSGFQTMIGPVQVATPSDWLPTTAVVCGKRVFESFRFDEWFEGYSYLEDLDFSYRVGEGIFAGCGSLAPVTAIFPGMRPGERIRLRVPGGPHPLHFVGKNPELSRLEMRIGPLDQVIAEPWTCDLQNRSLLSSAFLWEIYGLLSRRFIGSGKACWTRLGSTSHPRRRGSSRGAGRCGRADRSDEGRTMKAPGFRLCLQSFGVSYISIPGRT